jgi:SAM-dependent methyltransferase
MWAGRAADYERGFARLTAYTAGPLLDAAHVSRGVRLLDVGTGPGPVAAAGIERAALVQAVDADPQMVEIAARNAPGADVRVAVLPKLPHPDGGFDAAVGNFVINHVGDPPRALAELRRVLRSGGRLALTCWRHPHSRANTLVNDAMERAGVTWPAEDVPASPFLVHGTPTAFAGLLTEAGFKDVAVDEITWRHTVDPEEWWAGPRSGVGSTGMVLTRQDPATIARVKAVYDGLVAEYAIGDGNVSIPASALLAQGTA